MAITKLKITKSGCYNPQSLKSGFSARVKTNGIVGYEEIVAYACRNTSMHKAEAKACFELCMESVAESLKNGYTADLGPVGKLYPSCSSGWVEKAEELQLNNVTPKLNYRPSDEITSAIKGAILQWAKTSEATDDEESTDEKEEESGGPSTKPMG